MHLNPSGFQVQQHKTSKPSFQARLNNLRDMEKLRHGDPVIFMVKISENGRRKELFPKRGTVDFIGKKTMFSQKNSPCTEFRITSQERNREGYPIYASIRFDENGERISGDSIQVSESLGKKLKARSPLKRYFDF